MSHIPLISPDKYRFCQVEIKHTTCRFFFFFKFFLFLKQIKPTTTPLHALPLQNPCRKKRQFLCKNFIFHRFPRLSPLFPQSSHKNPPLLLQGIQQAIARKKPSRRTAFVGYRIWELVLFNFVNVPLTCLLTSSTSFSS